MKEGDDYDALYVLAQDPDVDRFSAAEKLLVFFFSYVNSQVNFSYPRVNGKWKVFSGDQLGTILAAWTLHCHKLLKPQTPLGKDRLWFSCRMSFSVYFTLDRVAIVASTVSSKMVESMARKEGFQFYESLTGIIKYHYVETHDSRSHLRLQIYWEYGARP